MIPPCDFCVAHQAYGHGMFRKFQQLAHACREFVQLANWNTHAALSIEDHGKEELEAAYMKALREPCRRNLAARLAAARKSGNRGARRSSALIFVIGLDDALHQAVPNHILLIEVN